MCFFYLGKRQKEQGSLELPFKFWLNVASQRTLWEMCGTMQPHQQSSGTNTTAVAKSQDGFTSLRFLYCQLVSAKMNSTWAVTWLTEEVAFFKICLCHNIRWKKPWFCLKIVLWNCTQSCRLTCMTNSNSLSPEGTERDKQLEDQTLPVSVSCCMCAD